MLKLTYCLSYYSVRPRGCKAYVYLMASKDGSALVVHSLSNEHNHDIVQV